jgi:hypothetical protein
MNLNKHNKYLYKINRPIQFKFKIKIKLKKFSGPGIKTLLNLEMSFMDTLFLLLKKKVNKINLVWNLILKISLLMKKNKKNKIKIYKNKIKEN